MPATVPVKTQFTWDKGTLRYRRNGQFVSARAVKLAVRRVVQESQKEMAAVTESMIRGDIPVGEWRDRFAAELKNLHVSGAMAGQGGPANMMRGDYLRVARGLKAQYRYLDRFAAQVKAGELSDAKIRQRAGMYVNSMQSAYEGGRQASAMAAGYLYERNVLGDRKDHCRTDKGRVGCVELTRQGWVEIGTMPVPGQRVCLTGCGCVLKFGKRKPAPKPPAPPPPALAPHSWLDDFWQGNRTAPATA